MLVDFFFPTEKIFSAIFDFHFNENPRFRDEFQALQMKGLLVLSILSTSAVTSFSQKKAETADDNSPARPNSRPQTTESAMARSRREASGAMFLTFTQDDYEG